ncbi:MAG: CC0125/CC1285 family lipoprotein [Caulobacterales bacterium]|jgi:hypothetical protein
MKRLILPVFAALALSACASPQPMAYQPAAAPRAVGFSEYRIEPGRYRVTFQGSPGAPRSQVSDYALRRAADLTLADGYDWFRVTERTVSWDGRESGSSLSVGVGGASFGRGSALGVGLGTAFNLGGGPALTATLEVLMGKGPKPQDGDVYDARGVQRSIGRG